jgi:hypothetical protein
MPSTATPPAAATAGPEATARASGRAVESPTARDTGLADESPTARDTGRADERPAVGPARELAAAEGLDADAAAGLPAPSFQRVSPLATAPPPGTAPELDLRAGELVEARLPADAPSLLLRLPFPGSAPAGGEVEVRVTSPDGRRELRERVRLPAGAAGAAGPVRLELPRAWLAAGVHRVEVHPRDTPGAEPLVFSFRVAEP